MKHKNTFSGLEFKRPPEINLHFPWGQFRIIYVLCRNYMAVCYLDTQDRQAEQNFDKMTFLDLFSQIQASVLYLIMTKLKF